VTAAEKLDSLDTYDAIRFTSKSELEAAINDPEEVWVVQVSCLILIHL